jgi:hypothetical protein
MILEGIVTTLSPTGILNIAPMGPEVETGLERFVLRPFRTAQTYQNLKAHPEGVLHVTDDVLLLAQAALGPVEPPRPCFPASHVQGWVLRDTCRYYEFRVTSVDDQQERARMEARVVGTGRLRDFFGFNRAKHAVVEAAILATRAGFLPLEPMRAQFRELEVLVNKTGGEAERAAFALLNAHIERAAQERSRAREQPGQPP